MSASRSKLYQNDPQCVQLARTLMQEIHSGKYKGGEKLESIRTLAERYKVGRQVVLSAFDLLAKQDLIYTKARSGVFVKEKERPFHYRIGFFKNAINPARSDSINLLYQIALRYGFHLICGSNFEGDTTLSDFLREKPDLDGVIISGFVHEELLREVSCGCLPYLVMGNSHISEKHPQIRLDYTKTIGPKLFKLVREKNWKSLSIICGPEYVANDYILGDTLKKFFQDSGCDCKVNTIYSRTDSYPELTALMKSRTVPDAIYFAGEHCLGFRKYIREVWGGKRKKNSPCIIISSPRWALSLKKGEYDCILSNGTNFHYEESVMKRMMELIHYLPEPPLREKALSRRKVTEK